MRQSIVVGNWKMNGSLVAYEPVWAIGTGETASPDQAQAVHAFIRERSAAIAEQLPLLYGGSVNADQCRCTVRAA